MRTILAAVLTAAALAEAGAVGSNTGYSPEKNAISERAHALQAKVADGNLVSRIKDLRDRTLNGRSSPYWRKLGHVPLPIKLDWAIDEAVKAAKLKNKAPASAVFHLMRRTPESVHAALERSDTPIGYVLSYNVFPDKPEMGVFPVGVSLYYSPQGRLLAAETD